MVTTTRKKPSSVALDRYAEPIGTVITDLLTLEFLLRLFLYEREDKPHKPFKTGQDLTGLRPGAALPENALTNYGQLRKLIKRYNEIVRLRLPHLEIGQNIAELRDALAHGRLFIRKNGLRLQLLKFTPPKGGKVKVNFAATLTLRWLTAQSKRVRDESAKVQLASNAFGARRAP